MALQLRDEEGAIALSIAKRFFSCLLSKSLLSEDEALDIITQAVNAEPRINTEFANGHCP